MCHHSTAQNANDQTRGRFVSALLADVEENLVETDVPSAESAMSLIGCKQVLPGICLVVV
jgi:hypothetical protein